MTAAPEPPRPENVVLQQLEQDDMPSKSHGDRRAALARKQAKGSRSRETPSTPAGPPASNDGLELPRSRDC